MILTGNEIFNRMNDGSGELEISPYDPVQLNPASYDLRLGGSRLIYDPRDGSLDAARDNPTVLLYRSFGEPFDLVPGKLYLMHTEEVIFARDLVVVIDGKSSLGRLGVSCHQTAGYGDPGFRGQYTLEVTVVHPTRLYVGMRFCQARFHTTYGSIGDGYAGNYKGSTAMGPVASRSWKQFEEDPRFRKGG